MNADFKVTSEQTQTQSKNLVTVFHLSGWLDAQGEEKLLTTAKEVHDAGTQYLVLNLENVSMLTSAGIRAIQKAQKLFSAATNLKICNAPPNVYHVLKMTGILQVLPMYESLQAALDSYIE